MATGEVTLEQAIAYLNTTRRSELRDHAFGDTEIVWYEENKEVASGYFFGSTASVCVFGGEMSWSFEGQGAQVLRSCGKLAVVERNDEVGPDEHQEGQPMAGLSPAGVYQELTVDDPFKDLIKRFSSPPTQSVIAQLEANDDDTVAMVLWKNIEGYGPVQGAPVKGMMLGYSPGDALCNVSEMAIAVKDLLAHTRSDHIVVEAAKAMYSLHNADDRPTASYCPSASIGDVIVVQVTGHPPVALAVETFGFEEVPDISSGTALFMARSWAEYTNAITAAQKEAT